MNVGLRCLCVPELWTYFQRPCQTFFSFEKLKQLPRESGNDNKIKGKACVIYSAVAVFLTDGSRINYYQSLILIKSFHVMDSTQKSPKNHVHLLFFLVFQRTAPIKISNMWHKFIWGLTVIPNSSSCRSFRV